jgi:hypothetical protein
MCQKIKKSEEEMDVTGYYPWIKRELKNSRSFLKIFFITEVRDQKQVFVDLNPSALRCVRLSEKFVALPYKSVFHFPEYDKSFFYVAYAFSN